MMYFPSIIGLLAQNKNKKLINKSLERFEKEKEKKKSQKPGKGQLKKILRPEKVYIEEINHLFKKIL